ncbi:MULTISPECIES: VIT1/CCC1 transporter family protein [Sphingomonas]|jgi:VIT1/CCC1 family predicted Fe2+/Mn2+ transporter|uniref:VIT family protein n=1 Tax=Sphingomonas sanguinis TaxID=33051 RepID=A0A7Y7UT59_9SPHN|nr:MULTISPECIES: VIT family protein [Sphingomonas]MBI0533499.1 VIT family protein [Sphingomonas sp. TX0522]MBZ6383784.1 VIT family protein [Sphingomonas sanguinis]NNG55558.1 VIT family protein [Sphingomonas sanguinis]NVP33075.1 VIT family protein [Sphingomonas sanguinis]OAN65064.1 hypothetical protein A7X12_17025 [Sphingomonas sp. TDK1]
MSRLHPENHLVARIGWLRAAVLGANDGIVSTASLVVGVAAASATPSAILLTGVAGLVAGAMSMAAGEYVSVSSQSDTEAADLAREAQEIADRPEAEHSELAGIYMRRGLDAGLAREVARQLMEKDALGAHAHDELGLTPGSAARPIQAALTSAATFSVGAAMPLLMAAIAPPRLLVPLVVAGSLVFLAILGALGARTGGAGTLKPTVRVTFWGALAMAVTSAVGAIFGAVG